MLIIGVKGNCAIFDDTRLFFDVDLFFCPAFGNDSIVVGLAVVAQTNGLDATVAVLVEGAHRLVRIAVDFDRSTVDL